MGSEWKKIVLGDLLASGDALLQTGPFGTALKAEEYTETGVPLISVREIREGFIEVESKTPRVDSTVTQRLPKFVLRSGDILFARKGGVERNALITEREHGWFVGSDGIYLRLSDKYCSEYYSYVMRSPQVKKWLLKNCEGTTMPSLNQKILSRIPIFEPPLIEQRKVAKVLRAFDKKISLNNQINQTLEQMAQTLFKSWFVDFDPVIDNVLDAGSYIPEIFEARVERRKTVRESADFKPLPDDVRQLFPSEFEESELGWVPKGWGIDSIYSCADLIYGAPFKSKQFNEDRLGLPVIRIRDLKTGKPRYFTEEDHPKKTLVRTGDILVGMDAEFRATIWSGSQGYLNQRLFYLKPKGENISNLFLKYTIQPLLDLEERAQVGTTVAHLGKKDIDKFRILVPTTNILEVSKVHFSELLSRIVEIYCENTALEKLRDTLLPKLISGELRLDSPEVE
ncbi:restriction endonuclease subunit S [Vibrio jasicida]|uniref:restriction endonuclease subunit S n=1 Tax=Vibrio jasicida TaxID=766224 RepID=UPI004068FB98